MNKKKNESRPPIFLILVMAYQLLCFIGLISTVIFVATERPEMNTVIVANLLESLIFAPIAVVNLYFLYKRSPFFRKITIGWFALFTIVEGVLFAGEIIISTAATAYLIFSKKTKEWFEDKEEER